MIKDILLEEIKLMYPPTNKTSEFTEAYSIHCSGYILDKFYEDFRKMGSNIPIQFTNSVLETEKRVGEPRYIRFQIPSVGLLIFTPDLDSGYKIEKQ